MLSLGMKCVIMLQRKQVQIHTRPDTVHGNTKQYICIGTNMWVQTLKSIALHATTLLYNLLQMRVG